MGGDSSNANINWLVTDQLGTPRMVFDQTGSLATTKRHDYAPFGEELFNRLRPNVVGYGAADSTRFTVDGYNFWLNKLNQFNGNFVNAEMVRAFLNSTEYRARFGS